MAAVEEEEERVCKRSIEANKVVMAAVENNGSALQYASEALRSDPEVVMVAVKKNGLALQCVTDELLRHDRQLSWLRSVVISLG